MVVGFQLVDNSYVAIVIEELLLSLHKSFITVQPFVYEMLVSCLMKCGQFRKLHQLIAYRVVEDSKPLVSHFLICSNSALKPQFICFLVFTGFFASLNGNSTSVSVSSCYGYVVCKFFKFFRSLSYATYA